MYVKIYEKINDINHEQWNMLLRSDNPFMRHEFLNALEESDCVCEETGWQPHHITIYQDHTRKKLLAAMPCYKKTHSYGEYIFDWAWAQAYHHYHTHYYPKLSNSIPFTPATGERWLIDTSENAQAITDLLFNTVTNEVEQLGLSSFHSLFITPQLASRMHRLDHEKWLLRTTSQFHWKNNNYRTFKDFLNALNSKKRKNIKRERRRVSDTGLQYRWLTGKDLNYEISDLVHLLYTRTVRSYGSYQYLNRDFFRRLIKYFHSHTLVLTASNQQQTIAAAIYFKSNDTLFGRYWGSLETIPDVHFETCYYQPIEWCIQQGYQRFEAGAQGEHKLARGLSPSVTYSIHYIVDPRFRYAIKNHIGEENQHHKNYIEYLQQHSPFHTK